MGLQETCGVTAELLKGPAHGGDADDGDPEADGKKEIRKLNKRAGSHWMVIRVVGEDSLLIACRSGVCSEMKLSLIHISEPTRPY